MNDGSTPDRDDDPAYRPPSPAPTQEGDSSDDEAEAARVATAARAAAAVRMGQSKPVREGR